MKSSSLASTAMLAGICLAVLSTATAPTEAATCVDRTWNHGGFSLALSDTAEHWSGKHRVAATFLYRCTCDSSCRSSCFPSFGTQQCTDSGVLSPGLYHKLRTSQRISGGSRANATSSGQNCGAGYACFAKTCLHNSSCPNFTIAAEARPLNIGMGIEFTTAAGDIVWDGQTDYPFQCDACMTVSEANGNVGESENNPDIQDDGNGGDSGGMPGGCSWRCVTRFYGQGGEGARVEDCSLSC